MSVYVALTAVTLALALTPAARAGEWEEPETAEEMAPEMVPPVLRSFTARISSYCYSGQRTRTGIWPYYGVVAVDPSVIRLGSHVTIEGLGGTFLAADTGGAIYGNRLDLYLPDCAAARRWGVQVRSVSVLE